MIKRSKIVLGDCYDVIDRIEDGAIDLIYMDPPFLTGRKHVLKARGSNRQFSFDDIWENGQEYAEFLEKRISKMKRVLSDTGSIFVHCDKNGEHIIRAVLDSVYGARNFQSEIIWSYKRWSNAKKGLLPAHQNIYFYSKTSSFKFNKMYSPYSETTNIDQILQRRTRDKNNRSVYQRNANGEVVIGSEKKGVPLGDVWEIPYLNPKAKERTGYPTQKPLLLLERIIELVTSEGDVVLDPFCGSGTTCVAAKLLKRKYIGIDISQDAIETTKNRIANPVKSKSLLMKNGRDSYKNADQNALELLNGIAANPVQRNRGIDAIVAEMHNGKPVLVRVQKDGETLEEAMTLLQNAMRVKKSTKSILIQTAPDAAGSVKNPREIVVIKSPALQIKEALSGGRKRPRSTSRVHPTESRV